MLMDDLFDLAVEELRIQRHDFMNYIQVIYGYIQINRPNDAVEYIKKINSRMQITSKIFNLECQEFGVLLHNIICTLYKLDIEVVFENEIDYIDNVIFSKNIDKIKPNFDIIKIKLEKLLSENFSDIVFINVSGTAEIISLYISNNNEIILDNDDDDDNNDNNDKAILSERISTAEEYSLELLSKGKNFCFKLDIFKIKLGR